MPEYHEMLLHVPTHSHDKLMKSVTKGSPVSVKLDLMAIPQDKLYVTTGQKRKIAEAMQKNRRDLTLRFTPRQVKYNTTHEGGFISGILSAAARFLPSILAGLLAGEVESHSNGNGMFLGHNFHIYQIRRTGEGLITFQPLPYEKIKGFYVRNGDNIYQGKGILHDLFGKIPILNLLV